MVISAIINNTNRINLVDFTVGDFKTNTSLKVQSTDLGYVKDLFENIQLIEVFFGETKVAEYRDYDGYSSIQYLGRVFSESEQRFVDCLQITLTKASLIDQINRIEEKLDDNIDFDAMTVAEYKQYLLDDISAKGEAEIYAGTGVVLSDGTSEVFTYNLKDQSNIQTAVLVSEKLDDFTMKLPYHSHSMPCRLYTAKDIIIIYMTLRMFAVEVQTRVNMLKNYIRTINDKVTLMTITYNTPLPEEYQNRYDEIITASMEVAEALKHKYFPNDSAE